ncbi:protein of unknown function [Candidatus Hydrogenisulfobacillus filiaventi]|uniref:Uncharacterized protein n=1 Tax=Candidatus Hydrogenisulfobacillus filiaventi TaxID=2707344 RepID=A0A6F8ZG20_9FIRM|nr:protein of unknown function [Candidatus Hydrogenisulfobacillus filiaventi]
MAPWWREHSKEVYASGLEEMARAASVVRQPKGPAQGPPDGLPPLPEERARPGVGRLHHRRDPAGRPKPRRPVPDRPGADPRADPPHS